MSKQDDLIGLFIFNYLTAAWRNLRLCPALHQLAYLSLARVCRYRSAEMKILWFKIQREAY